jgi:hypothetical protein
VPGHKRSGTYVPVIARTLRAPAEIGNIVLAVTANNVVLWLGEQRG